MKCQYCGKEESFPFKCQYCQGLFCAEHRIPENHNCPMIDQAKAPRQENTPPLPPSRFDYKVTYSPPRAKFSFSSIEIRDLAIATLLVSGVGLSLLGFDILDIQHFLGILSDQPLFVFVLLALFTSTFLMHEIAHKITAQYYGLWAEFRLVVVGALITLISVVSPFFKIIMPGTVMIGGTADKETIGKTSIAGPLTNIVFCTLALTLTFVLPSEIVFVAVFTAFFNAFIAVLNLIPVGIFDGWKVFQWNKIVWALAFAASVVLIAVLLSQEQYRSLIGF